MLSQLFRASIGLQKAFDLCFAQTGLTAQEAAVLLRCVDAEKMFAGKLAKEIDRDKGKITRFIDRLESSGFVRRESDARDHRVLSIKPTFANSYLSESNGTISAVFVPSCPNCMKTRSACAKARLRPGQRVIPSREHLDDAIFAEDPDFCNLSTDAVTLCSCPFPFPLHL